MVDDLKTRTVSINSDTIGSLDISSHYHPHLTSPNSPSAKSISSVQIQSAYQILDLEHNILQAKGLRTALCARIVHTKILDEIVIYVLRVEDVETGLQWVVHRRYRDFAVLNDELSDMSHFTKVFIIQYSVINYVIDMTYKNFSNSYSYCLLIYRIFHSQGSVSLHQRVHVLLKKE